jgi:hypothetical protein
VDLIKQGNPHAIRFVVRKPSTSYMKNIFLITFNLSVWVASVVVLAVFAVAVNIILNWETRNKQVSSCRLPDFFPLFYRVAESQTEQVRSERCNFNRIGSRLSTRLCFKGPIKIGSERNFCCRNCDRTSKFRRSNPGPDPVRGFHVYLRVLQCEYRGFTTVHDEN